MNIFDITQEIAEALTDIPGLRVSSFPPPIIQPPCAIVSFPESLDYNRTYGDFGADESVVPVLVVVSKVSDRAAAKTIELYADRKGDYSIKAAIERFNYTKADIVHVSRVTFDMYTVNEIDYLAATFLVDVVATTI